MRYDSPVAALLDNAARGNESAWHEIVRRYTPLVSSVCCRYRIMGADAEDIAGSVWLRLLTKLASIREPAALPGWLTTTTQRECLVLLRHKKRQLPSEQDFAGTLESEADTTLLADERHHALRDAVAELPDRDRALLSMLFAEPPMPYATISSVLGMPVGAIGPTRQRCLARMRRTPSIAALLAS